MCFITSKWYSLFLTTAYRIHCCPDTSPSVHPWFNFIKTRHHSSPLCYLRLYCCLQGLCAAQQSGKNESGLDGWNGSINRKAELASTSMWSCTTRVCWLSSMQWLCTSCVWWLSSMQWLCTSHVCRLSSMQWLCTASVWRVCLAPVFDGQAQHACAMVSNMKHAIKLYTNHFCIPSILHVLISFLWDTNCMMNIRDISILTLWWLHDAAVRHRWWLHDGCMMLQ